MVDNKNYYYLKLKENFFDSEEIKLLESIENGYLYSNILLKMYLKSLKSEGRLMFRENIPYNSKMLATITGHNPDIVEKAIKIFVEFGLIQILDSGAIYISDIQNFIGASSTEADRIRAYRNQIDIENKENKLICTNVQQSNDKSTPEINIELNKELDIEKEIDIKIAPQPSVADKKKKTVVIDYSPEFEEAFAIYPHHNGICDEKDKEDAWRKWQKLRKDISETTLLECAKNYAEECFAVSRTSEYCYKITNFYGRNAEYKHYFVKKPIKINEANNGQRFGRKQTASEHHAAVCKFLREM